VVVTFVVFIVDLGDKCFHTIFRCEVFGGAFEI